MYEREIDQRIPILFALSTCPRCRRMKTFLSTHHVQAVVVDVDLLDYGEKSRQLAFLRRVNPRMSMPTLVVGEMAVIGEDYSAVAEAMGLELQSEKGSGVGGVGAGAAAAVGHVFSRHDEV